MAHHDGINGLQFVFNKKYISYYNMIHIFMLVKQWGSKIKSLSQETTYFNPSIATNNHVYANATAQFSQDLYIPSISTDTIKVMSRNYNSNDIPSTVVSETIWIFVISY